MRRVLIVITICIVVFLHNSYCFAEETNIKIHGDVRLRHQSEKKEDDKHVRDRLRIRARVGITGIIQDQWSGVIGLASGGTDPRSTNQTLDNTFSTKSIMLDYAFIKYGPIPSLAFFAGKIKRENIIWQPTDLLWDSDVNPEGMAFVIDSQVSNQLSIFLNGAYMILDEQSATDEDIAMNVVQPGIFIAFNNVIKLKTAVGIYTFNNFKENATTMNMIGSLSNTTTQNTYAYDYNSTNVSIELAFENLNEFLKFISIFGDSVYNPDPDIKKDDERSGYCYGIKIGSKKVNKLGSWQFKILNRRLEKDAWVDFLPDSDFYGGKTGYQGIEAIIIIGLADNVTLSLDHYNTDAIDKNNSNKQNILQADINIKF
ncbi:putative porin [Candidatus Margulisiibacteriota bacterium]